MRTAYNRRRDVQLRRPSRRFEPASVDEFMRQSEMKTSVEMRRRMTSPDEQDRGGLREPYQDVYSITLNYFGHDVGYVHDPMHAAFSRFHSSLLRSFDLEDKGTSSFSSQVTCLSLS